MLQGGPVPGVRTIPGAYESERVNGWTFPLTLETCRILRQKLGKKLKAGPVLREWIRVEKRHRKSMHELAASSDAPLLRVPTHAPELAEAMASRPYQRVGTKFIADARRIVLADEQGLGKTLEIIAGVLEAGTVGPYLVVCPKTAVHAVWRREIERWLPEHRVFTLPDGNAERNFELDAFTYTTFPERNWLIVNPDVCLAPKFWQCTKCKVDTPHKRNLITLECGCNRKRHGVQLDFPKHPQLFEIEWGAVIVDECHDSLVRRSGNPTQRRNGLELLDVRADGLKIAASGTPMRDHPEKLWGALNWADRKRFSSYWNFVKSYWHIGGYSGWEIGEMMPEREKMLWDSLKPVVLRRTKAEVAKDLPPKTYVGTPLTESSAITSNSNVVLLPLTGKQEKAYRQMELDTAAVLRRGRIEALTPLAEMIRKRQLAASYGSWINNHLRHELPSNKFEYLLQLLEQLGFPKNPTTKVLVFSAQTRLLGMVSRELHRIYKRKITSAITGKTKNVVRGERIRRFNEMDHPSVMLLNIKAGGSAITIDSADHTVFLDRSPAYLEQQAEDRTHRVSNPRKVFYHYLVSEDTIDVGMSLLNAEQSTQTARLLDGRRMDMYAREAIRLTDGTEDPR